MLTNDIVSLNNWAQVLGLNPTGGRVQLTTVKHFIAQSFIITLPLSIYDLNNIERDVKH